MTVETNVLDDPITEAEPTPLTGETLAHPMAVSRVLKQVTRDYYEDHAGTGLTLTINAITGFVLDTDKTVTGTYTITGSEAPRPTGIQVIIKSGVDTEATVMGNADPTSNTWSAVIPANTLTAGSKTALANCLTPAAVSSPTAAFTVTAPPPP